LSQSKYSKSTWLMMASPLRCVLWAQLTQPLRSLTQARNTAGHGEPPRA
jgi:hypothetical protein